MTETLAANLAAVLFAGAPLALAALGETLSERAGVINLSVDGTILFAAMAAFAAARTTGNAWLGMAAGALAGALVAGVLAVAGLRLKAPILAVGFILTLLCRDLAYFLGHPHARQPGPDLGVWAIPGLADIPFLGTVIGRQSPVVYLSLAALAAITYFLYRTRAGLCLRAAGEAPRAAFARGIPVQRLRTLYCLVGGAFSGIAGAAYSLGVKPGWGHPQGAEGAGWIALAIVIFGGWRPSRVVLGAYFFALIQVAGIHLQDSLPGVPATIFQIAPFPVMIVTLLFINIRRSGRFRDAVQGLPLLGRLAGKPPAGAPGALAGVLDQDAA